MSLQNLLETFDPRETGSAREGGPIATADLEHIRSQAYENGYASGWEDATNADADARQRVEAEFERNIQNLAFTYNEAVDRVRGELKTFISELLGGLLPALVPDMLREHVRSELIKIADELIEAPIEIVCSPDCNPLIAELLETDFSMEIKLKEDASLAAGQVFIQIGQREVEIDLDPLLAALREQFQALLEPQNEKEAKHG